MAGVPEIQARRSAAGIAARARGSRATDARPGTVKLAPTGKSAVAAAAADRGKAARVREVRLPREIARRARSVPHVKTADPAVNGEIVAHVVSAVAAAAEAVAVKVAAVNARISKTAVASCW